jgi:hypothetical protein
MGVPSVSSLQFQTEDQLQAELVEAGPDLVEEVLHCSAYDAITPVPLIEVITDHILMT